LLSPRSTRDSYRAGPPYSSMFLLGETKEVLPLSSPLLSLFFYESLFSLNLFVRHPLDYRRVFLSSPSQLRNPTPLFSPELRVWIVTRTMTESRLRMQSFPFPIPLFHGSRTSPLPLFNVGSKGFRLCLHFPVLPHSCSSNRSSFFLFFLLCRRRLCYFIPRF